MAGLRKGSGSVPDRGNMVSRTWRLAAILCPGGRGVEEQDTESEAEGGNRTWGFSSTVL